MSKIVVQAFIKDPYIKNSRKLLVFDILWIICTKVEKHRKCPRKDPLEKYLIFLLFFSLEKDLAFFSDD